MSTTTAQPAPRVYTAADFVQDQTRPLDWPALRQWAEAEYGLTQQETWTMTRHSLIATMIAAEQHRAQDDHWGRWLVDAAD